jgi:hypothetical protein
MKWLCCVFQFGLENDSHDNTIDGHCLTENNTASWPDISQMRTIRLGWVPWKNSRDQRPWWFLKQWQITSHWRRTSLDLPTKQNWITHKNKKIPDEILWGDARSPDCSSYESAPCYVDTPEESNIQATNCDKMPDLHHIVICGWNSLIPSFSVRFPMAKLL